MLIVILAPRTRGLPAVVSYHQARICHLHIEVAVREVSRLLIKRCKRSSQLAVAERHRATASAPERVAFQAYSLTSPSPTFT